MRNVSKETSSSPHRPSSPMCGELGLDQEEDDQAENVFPPVRSRTDQSDSVRLFWSCFVVLCVAISTGYGSQLKFSLLNATADHFYPPFLMMWFNNCCLVICFPLYLIFEKSKSKNNRSVREITAESARIIAGKGIGSGLARQLFFLLLYTIGNYSYALSLGRITSSAALAVRSFDVSLVYLLGYLILRERFIVLKAIAVAFATGGVLLIAQDDQFAAHLGGVLLVLLSSAGDSVYKVIFKWAAGNASLGQTMFFLSGMALVNLPVNALPTAVLLFYGVERWEWAFVPWGSIVGFVLVTFVFNISTIFGVALLNPLIISIGVLCGIPISIGIDVLFRDKEPSPAFIVGTILLVASAILVTFHEKLRKSVGETIQNWRKNEQQGISEAEAGKEAEAADTGGAEAEEEGEQRRRRNE